ncbi:Alpha/Beta hydrolase protein [Rhodofomes roseus]|uniref:Alpha/Beta hydrolase protein n=1 Tax=Rhodofomes roseus TaxID=34475 RepID=A0ABQ8KWV3_9APHY|nr:Alpha/Beta hydrolase protein [Rhodofomes roseus]KAH9843701.1 Alpha/Beta hydrolase protein [Rhodofomes roseus]
MPLAPVDDKGTQFYYEDTGAPSRCATYTTLVLIHGGVFHSAIYRPIIPYAAARNVRLVLVNVRDYPGSTPYSASELAALRSGNREEQKAMLDERGKEVAKFLLWFIGKEKIPQTANGQTGNSSRTGELALLAWSWGNTITMAFLAQAAKLPQRDQEILGSYLRTLFLCSGHALGLPTDLAEFIMHPFRDAQIPVEQQGRTFERWVSEYYAHALPKDAALHSLTYDELKASLVQQPIDNPPPEHVATVDRLSSEQYADVVDPTVTARSHLLYIMAVDRSVYRDVMHDALWDSSVWPGLRVPLIWCDMSVSETVFAAWHFSQQVKENWPRGARKIDIVRFEGANHFPHWDEPQRMLELLLTLA